VHPQQCGYFRRKDRTQRRPELPRTSALAFHAGHCREMLVKYVRFGLYGLKTLRMRSRIERDPASKSYSDLAITPVIDAEGESLEMFELSSSSRAAVDKARRQARRHVHDEPAATSLQEGGAG
jgi:hypothetical protein